MLLSFLSQGLVSSQQCSLPPFLYFKFPMFSINIYVVYLYLLYLSIYLGRSMYRIISIGKFIFNFN